MSEKKLVQCPQCAMPVEVRFGRQICEFCRNTFVTVELKADTEPTLLLLSEIESAFDAILGATQRIEEGIPPFYSAPPSRDQLRNLARLTHYIRALSELAISRLHAVRVDA